MILALPLKAYLTIRRNIKNKRCFTLIELMIGIALMLIAGSTIGMRLHSSIEKKRFTSSLERLRSRLIDCRQLAINLQSDWKGTLQFNQGEWVFVAYTLDEAEFKNFLPLKLTNFNLFWNGDKVYILHFLFASTGEVRIEKEPVGSLFFSKNSYQSSWQFPQIFRLDEGSDGKKSGPVHPDKLL